LGSHKSYAVCTGETPANHFKASLKKQEYGVPEDDLLEKLAKPNGIVGAIARPGSVIIFDCNTMHGSNSNITPDPRSNAFFVYNAISNRVVQPFCDQPPRPEYIATRENVEIIKMQRADLESYRGELQSA
jgi:ectoine hydroxylase